MVVYMRGLMRFYRGDPAAAAAYVEADRHVAEGDSLGDGTGVARRFSAASGGPVRELQPVSSAAYAAWVGGFDPDGGRPKGRLSHHARAVRFVEVTINGPKSWSLAAELHADISAAYNAAQDRAAAQVISWLAQHATTRVQSGGVQMQVPVERLEAVTVRHYSSRAGDPHRHLHLQVNARVFAADGWRGLHTIGARDSLAAIQGIGHAAVVTDPQFRTALAAHGFSLDESGEIVQLAPFVRAFSRRAVQIAANLDRYESSWETARPGQHAGLRLRGVWNARAWADGRPAKPAIRSRDELHREWVQELAELGYRDPGQPIELTATTVGAIDRDHSAAAVLARLSAARPTWNAAHVRGEVEQLIARQRWVIMSSVREELAEDIAARTIVRCIRLPGKSCVPVHVRSLTSHHVLDVDRDVARRLAIRGAVGGSDADNPLVARLAAERDLEDGQARAVALLGGDRQLVVVDAVIGPAKNATIAAARDLLALDGRVALVVIPTVKPEKGAPKAGAELSTTVGTASWMAYQHGWRKDKDGAWTRLAIGDVDPTTGREHAGPSEQAALREGDLLIVDGAGMLDQDTAQVLVRIADERKFRLAFVGNLHQRTASGRGGVFDAAHRWVQPAGLAAIGERTPVKPRAQWRVVNELRQAWDVAADAAEMLRVRPRLERALAAQPRAEADRAQLAAAHERWQLADRAHTAARQASAASEQALTETTENTLEELRQAWDTQRRAAYVDAHRVQKGAGRVDRGRREVAAAAARLRQWAGAWQPIVGELDQRPGQLLEFAASHPSNTNMKAHLLEFARAQAAHAHPEHVTLTNAAHAAQERARLSYADYRSIQHDISRRREPDDEIADSRTIARMQRQVRNGELLQANATRRLAEIGAEAAVAGRRDPTGWLSSHHERWRAEREELRDRHPRDVGDAGAVAADAPRQDPHRARRNIARDEGVVTTRDQALELDFSART